MEEFPKKFGRFMLAEKIAQGGMAEIFMACDPKLSGPENPIVIKKLLPWLNDDKKLISMLISEAKITSLLEHPRIVKVIDIGAVGLDYFIEFEYVKGVSLDRLLARVLSDHIEIPSEVASYITEEVAKALDYAHNFKDSSQRPLNLIHRDVTPGNILLGWDGSVKLADFGIATASKNEMKKRPEEAFGKIFYMPPEQIWEGSLDKSSDTYSLAAVSYELLTSKKIFESSSEVELFEKIKAEEPALPSKLNPSLASADPVFKRALLKDKVKRWESSITFSRELCKVFAPKGKEREYLKGLLENLFKKEMEKEKTAMEKVPAILVRLKEEKSESTDPVLSPDEGDRPVERTEFIAKESSGEITGVVIKGAKEEKAEEAPKVEDKPPDQPKIRIKTKKITLEEFELLKKETSRSKSQQLSFELKDKEKEEEAPVKEETSLPIPEDVLREEPAPEIKEEEPEILEESPPLKTFEEEKSATTGKAPAPAEASEKTEIAKMLLPYKQKALLIGTTAIIFLILLYAVIKIIPTFRTQKIVYPKLDGLSHYEISLVTFVSKPDDQGKEVLERLLSQGKKTKYDSFDSLKRFMESETVRLGGKKESAPDFKFMGPVVVDTPPPSRVKFFNRNNVSDYFIKEAGERNIRIDKNGLYLLIYFYTEEEVETLRYPLIYRGPTPNNARILFLPLLKDEINASTIMLANRVLTLFGATEKTDEYGRPLIPDGLAEPLRNPLFPQRFAEVMARHIPMSPTEVKIASSLSSVRIGPKTALETGLITEKDYETLAGKTAPPPQN